MMNVPIAAEAPPAVTPTLSIQVQTPGPTEMSSHRLPGRSAAMEQVRQQVARLGPHFRRVLISGDTGSDRERIARALHRASPGARGSFVVCALADLEESAALWKQDPRVARIALRRTAANAAGGTLWIDDVATLSAAAQILVLRLLDERPAEGERLRLITGTAANLKAMCAAGAFLQELRLAISALELPVPPLRARRDDIAELARSMAHSIAQEYAIEIDGISDDLVAALEEYSWPGNEAEMENTLRMAVLSSNGGLLTPEHVQAFEISAPAAATIAVEGMPDRLQDVVDQHLLRILAACDGNKLRAADRLGVSRSTLYRMLEACAATER